MDANQEFAGPTSASTSVVRVTDEPEGFEDDKKSLDEGPAVLRLPKDLSPESVDDLEYWLEGVLRRLKRKSGAPPSS